jgi:ATP/maltotriose-dependent transcriptional regulator MalT
VTPPEQRALFELMLAYGCYSTVDFAGMRAWSDRAIEHAVAGEVTIRLAAEAMNGFASILLGEPERGRPAIEGAVAELATIDDATLAARIDDAWLIAVACLLGELPELGLPVATRAIGIARATRQDRVIPMLAAIRSMLYEHHLLMDESLHDVETATEAARLLGSPGQLHQALVGRSIVLWLRGDRAEAVQSREECLEIVGQLERSTMVITSVCNAAVQLVDEDPARCIREMTAAAGPLLERVDRTWSTLLLGMLVRAAISLGRLDDAERWTQRIEEHAALTQVPGALARAAIARAELLLARGEPAEAARLAIAAADAAEAGGMRLDAVFGRLTAGRALGAAGERQEAIAMLQRVAADAGRGSAGLFVEAAGRELRKLGTRVSATSRRAAAPTDAALSEREQAIADLVAEGRTNKQVAATLFLAEKTVEHHLSRIYAKLGVRSRVELASRLAR